MGFDTGFIELIEVLINRQEICVINDEISTGYFKLERGSTQGNSFNAYLFILVIKVFSNNDERQPKH